MFFLSGRRSHTVETCSCEWSWKILINSRRHQGDVGHHAYFMQWGCENVLVNTFSPFDTSKYQSKQNNIIIWMVSIHSNALLEIHISSRTNCTHVIYWRREHLRMISRNCSACSWNRRDETKQHTNDIEYLKKNTRRNECEIKAKASDEMTEIVPAFLRVIYVASNSRHF